MREDYKKQRYDHPSNNEVGREMLLRMNVGHKHISDFFFENVTITKDDLVLEIGCGGGYNASELAKRAKRVIAIDISAKAVEVTREFNDQLNMTNLDVKNISIEDSNFMNDSFDIITAFSTIYFWSDLSLSLQKIYQYLKIGGRFYIMIATSKDD